MVLVSSDEDARCQTTAARGSPRVHTGMALSLSLSLGRSLSLSLGEPEAYLGTSVACPGNL